MNRWKAVLDSLEKGTLRAATKTEDGWEANLEIKQEILNAFKEGRLVKENDFIDKHNLMPREFFVEDGVRIVPGGTSIRRGSYVASGVIIMPPSYVNIGTYIDEGTMVDSNVLIGSCAQIGKNVHISAGVQIGGVLEPIGQNPVIIEDNVFIGANSAIVEGIIVKKGAVIAPGTILSKGVPVYDCVSNQILEKGADIPEKAVVVPGSRTMASPWAKEFGLNVNCALIVKYRDEKSDSSLELENALR